MTADPASLAALALLVLLAATLYSSVGHAGATAYLAAMALFGVAPAQMKPAALVMNMAVASVGTWRYARAAAIPWRTVAVLVVTSIPAAFLGGAIDLPARWYRPLLGATLLVAALRLWRTPAEDRPLRDAPTAALLGVGGGLGFLSGLTGIGGGVFLSPVLILAGWESPRRTAGASVTFILVNSIAGFLGHAAQARDIPEGTALLTAVAVAGGAVGSWLGAQRLAPVGLRRLLALVLVIGGGKLLTEGRPVAKVAAAPAPSVAGR